MAILQKRSLISGSIPTTSSLAVGEIAINVPDGRIFLRKSGSVSDTIQSAITTGASNTGSVSLTGSLDISGSSGTVFSVGGDTMEFTGSVVITGSVVVTGSINATSFTGSLFGTSSWSINALTASYFITSSVTSASLASTASFVTGSIHTAGNLALSSSYALSASWAPGSSGGLTTKSNTIAAGTFTGSPKKATVTFTANFATTNYGITVTGEDARSWTIESKTVSGFTINSNSSVGLSGNTYWHAILYGEA